MGQGGYIALINGTSYDWIKTGYNTRSFPETIHAGTSSNVYVEWGPIMMPFDPFNISANVVDYANEAVYYILAGTGLSFLVQARAALNGLEVEVQFTSLETPGNPKGSTLNLGLLHYDGLVAFILAGEKGSFTSTNLPSKSWMHDNLNILGKRSLRHLCMPGSHDAGMSTHGTDTAFGFECNTKTQSQSISGQLNLGSRYFDIRPVISGGHYYTGHYSRIPGGLWQGANGQSIQSIIDEVNDFTATNKELVILDFSHDLNTDTGKFNYKPFTQKEWDALLGMLNGINNLFSENPSIDLTSLTLSNFIGNNNAAVVIIIRASVALGNYEGKGFFLRDSFGVYDKYTGTDDLDRMVKDQLSKMKNQRPNPDAPCFLLSWTLTQGDISAAACFTGFVSSVLELANKANREIYADKLFNSCSSKCYPNILFIDDVSHSNITALAMAINFAFGGYQGPGQTLQQGGSTKPDTPKQQKPDTSKDPDL